MTDIQVREMLDVRQERRDSGLTWLTARHAAARTRPVKRVLHPSRAHLRCARRGIPGRAGLQHGPPSG